MSTTTPSKSRESSGGDASPELLRGIYRAMYRIRRVEEAIAEEYPKQEMRCPVHLCIGQEAPAAAVCSQLRHDDYVFSTHRSHGHYLAKGGSLDGLLGELFGRATGCSGGKGGSMHMIDLACGFLGAAPILGATTALAVGAAMGVKMRREDKVTVAFFGDAAMEEGIFYEVVNFAALKQLPVLMVCENNGLSTLSPLSVRQPAGRQISDVVQAIGVPSVRGNGNDALDVLRLAKEAVGAVRGGAGPRFLEFATDRWREHCGPGFDQAQNYRSTVELERAMGHDPIPRLAKHMIEQRQWSQREIDAVEGEVRAEVDASFERTRKAPYPAADMLLAEEYAP